MIAFKTVTEGDFRWCKVHRPTLHYHCLTAPQPTTGICVTFQHGSVSDVDTRDTPIVLFY